MVAKNTSTLPTIPPPPPSAGIHTSATKTFSRRDCYPLPLGFTSAKPQLDKYPRWPSRLQLPFPFPSRSPKEHSRQHKGVPSFLPSSNAHHVKKYQVMRPGPGNPAPFGPGPKRQGYLPPITGTTGAPPDPKRVEPQEIIPTERARAEALRTAAWIMLNPTTTRIAGAVDLRELLPSDGGGGSRRLN